MIRVALRILQLGAFAVVLAASPREVFDLDRFLVPKELVLHGTALLAGAFALRRIALSRVDWLLLGYLLLSALSAVFAANPWIGVRAVALSASAVLLFWVARSLREAGLSRPLLNSLALAVVLAALTALLQAYGLELTIFPGSRAPGGTLGNRNFVGHAAAFGLPLVLLAALRARRFVLTSLGVTIVAASLVLTRSRAAWLACAVSLAVFFVAMLVSRSMPWKRVAAVAVFGIAGIAAALLIPNALRWRSDNPYLESVQGVVNYEGGSGRGRLVQYTHSLRMAAAHPLLGVGAGNWPVRYPEFAARNDGSLNDSEPGTTFNPWPSSDWVAFVSERGFAAAALLGAVFVVLFARAWRCLRGEGSWEAATLMATIAAAGVAGAFDAVLLLALPAFLVWCALGVLECTETAGVSPAEPAASRRWRTGEDAASGEWPARGGETPPRQPAGRRRSILQVAIVLVSLVGVIRSTSQLIAMEIYATRGDRASLERAARIDPGNYRVRLRLARKGRCAHALAARGLFPNAEAAKAAARRCR
ncbi:MAG TPA: O-antigen ligase family protein [Thermoanaerobaculia bacterium]|nr:O-antigen ligase family protein [Thermoanaerobaculia bacterium]